MIRRILSAVSAASLTIVSASPAWAAKETSADPLTLDPSSNWNVDYAADKCRLARAFGTGKDQVVFFLERYAPTDRFFLLVAGAPLTKFDASRAQLRFGPGGDVTEYPPSDGKLKDMPALMTTMALYHMEPDDEPGTATPATPGQPKVETDLFAQKISPEMADKITWFEAVSKGQRPLRLALGSMGKPIGALQSCTQELVGHWGIDVEAHRTLLRPASPRGDPSRWMTSSDYPSDLMKRGAQGIVHFRLLIGPDGKPTDCFIQESTRPKGFDDAVCAVMIRRARFDPALDKTGNPIKSYWRSSVRFLMP